MLRDSRPIDWFVGSPPFCVAFCAAMHTAEVPTLAAEAEKGSVPLEPSLEQTVAIMVSSIGRHPEVSSRGCHREGVIEKVSSRYACDALCSWDGVVFVCFKKTTSESPGHPLSSPHTAVNRSCVTGRNHLEKQNKSNEENPRTLAITLAVLFWRHPWFVWEHRSRRAITSLTPLACLTAP